MINLLRLRDELIDNTYPMATLACERIVRQELDEEIQLRIDDLYEELSIATDNYLRVVKHFAEQVKSSIPPDDLSYMKEQQLALTKLADLIDYEPPPGE